MFSSKCIRYTGILQRVSRSISAVIHLAAIAVTHSTRNSSVSATHLRLVHSRKHWISSWNYWLQSCSVHFLRHFFRTLSLLLDLSSFAKLKVGREVLTFWAVTYLAMTVFQSVNSRLSCCMCSCIWCGLRKSYWRGAMSQQLNSGASCRGAVEPWLPWELYLPYVSECPPPWDPGKDKRILMNYSSKDHFKLYGPRKLIRDWTFPNRPRWKRIRASLSAISLWSIGLPYSLFVSIAH